MKEPFNNPAITTWVIEPAIIENTKEKREEQILKHWTDWTETGSHHTTEEVEFNTQLETRRYNNVAVNASISSIKLHINETKPTTHDSCLMTFNKNYERKVMITVTDSALAQQLINAFPYLHQVTPQVQPGKTVLMTNNSYIKLSTLFFMLNSVAPFSTEMKTNIETFFHLKIHWHFHSKYNDEKKCMLFTPRSLKELAKLATRLKGLEKLSEDIQKLSFS